jgi:4-hydroxybenzoate polyprenyltransferase
MTAAGEESPAGAARCDVAGRRPFQTALFCAMRPAQWTKNLLVLAAFFFAFWDRSQPLPLLASLARVIPAALLFCLTSSSVYLLNDIRDADADRRHPVKRFRPVACGDLSPGAALLAAMIMLASSCGAAWLLSSRLALVLASYTIIQLVYTLGLKRVALVDVLVIAGGFVLRAIAGAVVLDVAISPWLLLCTFLLALFLALCKRRHEKILVPSEANAYRPSLDRYDRLLLDQLIAIVSGATIVSYALYTLSADTVAKFGTPNLGFTIPFVVFGIFRYLDLVYRKEQGGRPERILLTDLPLLVDLGLYAAAVAVICLPAS